MVADRFDMNCAALVRDRDELAAAIADNPFAGTNEDRIVHTMFLDGQPSAEQFDALATDHWVRPNERLALGDRALYIDFGDGAADSKLNARLIDRTEEHTSGLQPLMSNSYAVLCLKKQTNKSYY